ncbi:MAG: class I SAM-dependent methyltransferase [Candidatus Diapherotrites archaeon]
MKDYEETKKDYENGFEWHREKSYSYIWKNQIGKFVKYLDGKKILDAGCGGGRDVPEFMERGFDVDGIDYSTKAIKYDKEKYPEANFYEGDIRKMEFPDKSYDGVWACASIANLDKEDAHIALAEFRRILKDNGILFVSIKLGEGERKVPDQAGERFYSFYSPEEIEEFIEDSGFNVDLITIVTDFDLTGELSTPPKPGWVCLYAIKSGK